MSTLNLRVGLLAFSDLTQNTNPQIRNVDLSYNLLGMNASRPKSEEFAIAPGFTQSIFNGTRTTAIDSTTTFNVTQPVISQNTYRFTAVSGTLPAFRTDRLVAVDITTQFSVTVNGGVSTLTNIAGTAPNFTSVVVGDVLNIFNGSGFNPVNQGRYTIIAKTSNSISIQNLNAVAETVTILDPTLFLVYSNGGSGNQTQIGDKVLISSGFSQYSQGTYVITEVAPNFIEVSAANPNGLPLETGIMPGAAGFVIYNAAKSWLLIAAQQKCSVQVNSDVSNNSLIEPSELNNPEQPGLYLKNGTVYALSVTNLSLDTLIVTVATAE